MNTISTVFEYEDQFKEFVEYNSIPNSNKVFLQVFTNKVEVLYIKRLLSIFKKYLPNIAVLGTTTAGNIQNCASVEDTTVLTFTICSDTVIKTRILESKGDSFELGYDLINSFDKSDINKSNLIISFADSININGEEFLNGISSSKSNITVSGGLAADKNEFKASFVFNETEVFSNASAAALFINKELNVFTDYNFNWQTIGKTHTIEKSYKNRVFKIDGKTALEFYSYYLGKDIAKLLPAIGSEFPLIIQNSNLETARVVTSKNDDGSLLFSGNVKEGSEIKLGYGNVQIILEQANSSIESLNNIDVQSIFIYSCVARKLILKDNINIELFPFKELTNANGCFLFGEFFSKTNKQYLLNETMTFLALSEGENKVSIDTKKIPLKIEKEKMYEFSRLHGLSMLVNQTTKELEELNTTLENRVRQEVENSIAKDSIVEANSRNAQMGEMIDMIVHQWRQPLNAFSTGVSNLKFQAENDLILKDAIINTSNVLMKNVNFLNETIEDFRNYFKSSDEKEFIKPEKLITKTMFLFNSMLTKYSISINKNFSYNDYIRVPIGKSMQVILNIIKNSIDVIIEKNIKNPEINISTFTQNNYCILEIEDNAGGIEDEISSKIFEKRFTTKGDKEGTGLGLYMSRSIMKMHLQGELQFRNSAKGSVFILKIPLELD